MFNINFILGMVWGFIWVFWVQMSIFENYLLKRIFCLLNHIECIYQWRISKTEYMNYFSSSIFSICLYFYYCTSVIYVICDLTSIKFTLCGGGWGCGCGCVYTGACMCVYTNACVCMCICVCEMTFIFFFIFVL